MLAGGAGSFFSRHLDADCLNPDTDGGASPLWCTGGLVLAVVVVVAAGAFLNDAVTAWSEVIATLHPAVPVHTPLQPAKVEPAPGVAVSASVVEAPKIAEQVPGHSISVPFTVPLPLPARVTVRVLQASDGAAWPSHARWTSTAPMSAPSPPTASGMPANSTGRGSPRWSVASPNESPASITGLSATGAIVSVGPPLSANGPSIGPAVRGEPEIVPSSRAAIVWTRSKWPTSASASPRLVPPSLTLAGLSEARSTETMPWDMDTIPLHVQQLCFARWFAQCGW
jgi:hypothetical protein